MGWIDSIELFGRIYVGVNTTLRQYKGKSAFSERQRTTISICECYRRWGR